jgi:hypothetical protein
VACRCYEVAALPSHIRVNSVTYSLFMPNIGLIQQLAIHIELLITHLKRVTGQSDKALDIVPSQIMRWVKYHHVSTFGLS